MNRDKIIETMARAMDAPSGQEYMPVMRQFAERALTTLHAEGLAVVPVKDVRRMREALALVDKGFRTNRLKDASIIVGDDVKALSEIVRAALSPPDAGKDTP
tara:strand:+ start:1258 stop:1563 length:306 start_codon:yes stop_codon:yes gene_type:complete